MEVVAYLLGLATLPALAGLWYLFCWLTEYGNMEYGCVCCPNVYGEIGSHYPDRWAQIQRKLHKLTPTHRENFKKFIAEQQRRKDNREQYHTFMEKYLH